METLEVTREDGRSGPVFIASPATAPPIRTRAILIAGLIAISLLMGAEMAPESIAGTLRWLAIFCTVPVLLLWVVMLTETVRRRGVRLAVTPAGLTVNGRTVYPHDTIRDLVLYPQFGKKPLFIAHVAPDSAYGHQAELALATGRVPVESDVAQGHAKKHAVRLVMRRRKHLRPIILVQGLTLSAGETLLAALAAELRPHSR